MPITNLRDAHEVRDVLTAALDATETDQRIGAMRRLFVEVLDFEPDNRPISLGASLDPALPDDALSHSSQGWCERRLHSDHWQQGDEQGSHNSRALAEGSPGR